MRKQYCRRQKTLIKNKNAFQQDAYRPLVNRMLQSASRGGVPGPGGSALGGVPGLGGGGCLLWGEGRGVLVQGGLLWGGSAPGGDAWSGGCPVWGVCLV